jgi:hypothetical protein
MFKYMRVLITGANGQLGRSLSLIFKDSILASSSELNIASIEDVKNLNQPKLMPLLMPPPTLRLMMPRNQKT